MARYQLPKFGDENEEASIAVAQAEPEPSVDIFDTWQKPPMCYKNALQPPGYRLKDLASMLHVEDFAELVNTVGVCGEVDGEPIVYALDYVRWRIWMES